MVKDKNAMIARDEQKLKEFKEEMTKKYLTHRAETSLKLNQEMASKTEDEFEQHIAEQCVTIIPLGVTTNSILESQSYQLE